MIPMRAYLPSVAAPALLLLVAACAASPAPSPTAAAPAAAPAAAAAPAQAAPSAKDPSALTTTFAPGSPQAALTQAELERDFRQLLEWFPGEWDNQEQVGFAEDQGVPEPARHERIHSIFARVELPEFGKDVFYVQQYTDDDPAKIYRQRIYSFSADWAERAVRLDIFTPKAPAKLVDAHLDPAKLKGLTKKDVTVRPGCEVWWRRQANQFIGNMKPGACSFTSERSGKKITIQDDLILTPEEIWISDRAVDDTGAYVFGNIAGIPHKLRKAKEWVCWMAVPKAPGPDGKPGGWTYANNMRMLDQGGRVWVQTEEAKPRQLGFRIRQVKWPEGTNRDAVTLYVHEKGVTPNLGYAWADPDAKTIGINLKWMQGACRRK